MTEGSGTKAKVKTGLSAVRTLAVGAQILMGFEYRAAFEPVFEDLSTLSRLLVVAAMVMLAATLACLIAPTTYHRIVARGHATSGMHRHLKRMASAALAPFALALGANVDVALSRQFDRATAASAGIGAAMLALACWYGPVVIRKRTEGKDGEMVKIDDRVDELLKEVRIVLPGVQALLGFQFASYLMKSFEALPPSVQGMNTAAMGCLVVAMVLLMMPAPLHRIAADGDAAPWFERAAERLMLGALPFLALGVAGDVFVVTSIVLGSTAAAVSGTLCVTGMVVLWFGVPLYLKLSRAGRDEALPVPNAEPRSAAE